MRCIFWHCINPPTKVILPTPPISHWMWMILPCHCNIPKNGNNCADYCNYLGQSPHATYSGSPVTGPPTTNWAVQLVYNWCTFQTILIHCYYYYAYYTICCVIFRWDLDLGGGCQNWQVFPWAHSQHRTKTIHWIHPQGLHIRSPLAHHLSLQWHQQGQQCGKESWSLSFDYCCYHCTYHCQWGVRRVAHHPVSTNPDYLHILAPERRIKFYILHRHCIYMIHAANMQCRAIYLLEGQWGNEWATSGHIQHGKHV